MNTHRFDVVVIGGGHAGIEAAYAAARMGSSVALVTLDLEKIGTMPCNPAIGGIGKGHLVFEVSALGGLMPQLCTSTYLQARMLNTKKGPAVQGLRLQIDKHAYAQASRKYLEKIKNLTLIAGTVDDIVLKNGTVSGVQLNDGTIVSTTAVIVTTGTFLNGKIHIGTHNYDGGRRGEKAVKTLAQFFRNSGLKIGRLKTGTPPRLLYKSLDLDRMERQEAEELTSLFEFYPHKVSKVYPCYITHTNEKTHDIIRKNLNHSAMYSGNITGVGPRYCPSIEDKIARFADKASHHVFVEPEDADMVEVYPNGISTSLPAQVQQEYIQSIRGFENARITKLGYAIEYDFVYPNQLKHSLEVKQYPGLFLAGQINGTTGYEEAAAQGLIAGINAHQLVHNEQAYIPDRSSSYIGVMIDDLITMGIDEPYRMFTSRAERRLILRQDNAFIRLGDEAHAFGLISDTLYKAMCQEKNNIEKTITSLKDSYSQIELLELFKRSAEPKEIVLKHAPEKLPDRAILNIQATFLYEPYIKREEIQIARREQYKHVSIPESLCIQELPGLSKELQEKFERYKPSTVADAALIPGMTPAALSLLVFKVKEHERLVKKRAK